MMFDSMLISEYQELKDLLKNDTEIINLVNKKNGLLKRLGVIDRYSNEYQEVYIEYVSVSNKLLSDDRYSRFKEIERELNLFLMICNKKLKNLFDLSEKGCKH